ncbi:N-6 DNA methylase [Pseudofulvimonas gallinarii]|uniref:N-6 DNA methylase n=1 Tax=Pseudofulvimonas gallinarii TaxID=634155 RepID=UPI001FFCD12B|nr:N-6 DNA methylase [Pseudofulvimonas gallinarii]
MHVSPRLSPRRTDRRCTAWHSDAFDERRAELQDAFADASSDLHLPDPADHAEALEERDYYTMANVFWVPASARWEAIRAQAKQADIGVRIDAALEAIEADNPRLKGILDKRFGRTQLEPGRLGELVDLVSTIGFGEGHRAKDLLGEVYEYFLGQFASAEGKKGGQFYTPATVVKVLVEVLAPHHGRVYDPCCGSGGMFVQSEKFIEAHGGKADDISIYGQEANPTTWRLVAMNLAIRGLAADLGKEPADTFHRDQHPDLRADYILANPPFNISDWGGERLADDKRWVHGTPPAGNANYAWLQHILFHLSPRGQAGVVLANGSMSSNQNNEGAIRRAMVEADVVDVMVALPPQLFFNTQIPACLWFLARDKSGAAVPGGKPARDRRGEVLFIDARKLGRMATRVNRVFDDEDIARIAATVHRWRADGEDGADEPYADVPGFCRAVNLAEIAEHGHVLTPGRYVGAEETEDDDEAFNEKMERLTAQLAEQITKGARLARSSGNRTAPARSGSLTTGPTGRPWICFLYTYPTPRD